MKNLGAADGGPAPYKGGSRASSAGRGSLAIGPEPFAQRPQVGSWAGTTRTEPGRPPALCTSLPAHRWHWGHATVPHSGPTAHLTRPWHRIMVPLLRVDILVGWGAPAVPCALPAWWGPGSRAGAQAILPGVAGSGSKVGVECGSVHGCARRCRQVRGSRQSGGSLPVVFSLLLHEVEHLPCVRGPLRAVFL